MAARTGFSALRKHPSLLTPEGITFGNRLFSEPRRYPRFGGPFLVPSEQGLYVILTPDHRLSPRPFAALYFGEAPDLQQRLTGDHEKYPEWMRRCTDGHMFFAYHATPNLTDEQRREAERGLIAEYHPVCNDVRPSLRLLRSMRIPSPSRIQ